MWLQESCKYTEVILNIWYHSNDWDDYRVERFQSGWTALHCIVDILMWTKNYGKDKVLNTHLGDSASH